MNNDLTDLPKPYALHDFAQKIDLSKRCTQRDFARIIDISEVQVSLMVSSGVIGKDQSLGEWIHRYCFRIREQAAGRATKGDLDLATERAALAREQKIRIEMQNAVTRREYAPIAALEIGLSDLMAKIAKQFDSIPGKLRIASDQLTADDLDIVSNVIAGIRNEIAGWNIDWFGDREIEDTAAGNNDSME